MLAAHHLAVSNDLSFGLIASRQSLLPSVFASKISLLINNATLVSEIEP